MNLMGEFAATIPKRVVRILSESDETKKVALAQAFEKELDRFKDIRLTLMAATAVATYWEIKKQEGAAP